MIATHNTFTYLPAQWYIEPFARFWRCHTVDAYRQVVLYGVEVCDIRVTFYNGKWQLCHGLARFGSKYDTLELLIYDCLSFGFKLFRLICENNHSYNQFEKEVCGFTDNIKMKCIAVIHKPTWEYLVPCGMFINEHNKHMWYKGWPLWKNIINFLYPSIKKYAKKNNTFLEDKAIHMYDYLEYMKYEIT